MTKLQTTEEETPSRWQNRNADKGHIWTGIFLLIVGGVALAKSLLLPVPAWLFSWQTFLIVFGIFFGVRGNFHGAAWLIMIIIGTAFLVNDFYPSIELQSRFWPLTLVCVGVLILFRSRPGPGNPRRSANTIDPDVHGSKEDIADITTFFGSTKKAFISRQFAGGDITCFFGSTQLDLTHADIKGEVLMDVTTICGGVELIVPAHWTIKSDVVSVFGSVRDKRDQSVLDPEKLIVLDGTAFFGGIEIRSFKK